MRPIRALLRHVFRAVFYTGLGAVLVGGWLYIGVAQRQPDLRAWHLAELNEEFRGADDERVTDYASYVALEDALFKELHREVYESGDPATTHQWSRYHYGGPKDASTTGHEWNRSMELPVENAVGGALLLHGATDSPYSMRALAELLHAEGWHVVIPRYQGHGTAPAGLTTFKWEDLALIADLAATHLREQIGPEAPMVAFGYSTGAALAAEHALAVLEGEEGEQFDRIITLSPAMGVSAIAAFAETQVRISNLLGIPKLAWTSIQPEYDPYKYNSFSVNAGDQVYELTVQVNERMARLADENGVVRGMPPTLSFMSLVDATVNTSASLAFHNKLAAGEGHSVVLFDVDRTSATEDFLKSNDLALLARLPARANRHYDLTVIANKSEESDELAAWDDDPSRDGASAAPLGVHWPKGVYSLTHVALPFRDEDPFYGLTPGGDPNTPSLGNLQLRGERGLLIISGDSRMRLRSNPFFDYIAMRTLAALESDH